MVHVVILGRGQRLVNQLGAEMITHVDALTNTLRHHYRPVLLLGTAFDMVIEATAAFDKPAISTGAMLAVGRHL